jgi:hypothetical protein
MGLGIKIPKGAFDKGREAYASGDDYNNVTLPRGRYICAITGAKAKEIKGEPKVILEATVGKEHEEFSGGKVAMFFTLDEEKSVHLFRALAKLGFEVDDLDEKSLEVILNKLEKTNPVVRISAEPKGEFTNYKIADLQEDLTAAEVLAAKEDVEATEEEVDEEETEEEEASDDDGEEENDSDDEESDDEEEDDEEEESEEEEEDDEVVVKVGTKVSYNSKSATVTSMPPKGNKVQITYDKSKKTEMVSKDQLSVLESNDEEEEESDDEGEVQLKPGMKVVVTIRGKESKAVVKEINTKTGKVKVTLPDKTTATVTAQQIEA